MACGTSQQQDTIMSFSATTQGVEARLAREAWPLVLSAGLLPCPRDVVQGLPRCGCGPSSRDLQIIRLSTVDEVASVQPCDEKHELG